MNKIDKKISHFPQIWRTEYTIMFIKYNAELVFLCINMKTYVTRYIFCSEVVHKLIINSIHFVFDEGSVTCRTNKSIN
jgi:hypothetical protein